MPTKKSPKKFVSVPAEGLVLVRYGTPDNSWISAYANVEVAKKHLAENALLHFADHDTSDGDDEDDEIPCAADMEADIRLKVDQKEEIIEFGGWSAEINYNENVYTV